MSDDATKRPQLTPTQRQARDAMLDVGYQEALTPRSRYSSGERTRTKRFSEGTFKQLESKGYAQRKPAIWDEYRLVRSTHWVPIP